MVKCERPKYVKDYTALQDNAILIDLPNIFFTLAGESGGFSPFFVFRIELSAPAW